MKTLLNKEHIYFLPKKIDENSIASFLRGNHFSMQKRIDSIFSRYDNIYIYVLDGDKWSEWSRATGLCVHTKMFMAAYDISPFKDCICAYADEFVIISPTNIDSCIKSIMQDEIIHDGYKMTTFVTKASCSFDYIDFLKTMKKIVKNQKGMSGDIHYLKVF